MSTEAMADAGIDPIMESAVAARLRWKERLGPKEKINGVEPTDYRAAIDAIAANMAVR